jgi:hypothetical protein
MIGVAQIHGLGPATLIRLEGKAGVPAVESLAIVFARLAARRVRLVVVELSGLTLLSRRALGALVGLWRDLGRWGGRLRLASTPRPSRRRSRRRASPTCSICTARSKRPSRPPESPARRAVFPNRKESHMRLLKVWFGMVAAWWRPGEPDQGPPEEPSLPNWVRYLYSDQS